MPKIVLNLPRYKGEYDFDIEAEPFTALEWRWVKRISGYMPMTIDEGWRGGDPDLFVALAVVAMNRAGKLREEDVFTAADTISRAPFDGTAITIVADEDDQETEADPTTPEIAPPIRSIGGSSPQTLESQVVDLSRTGALA